MVEIEMNSIKIIDREVLSKLTAQAMAHPRLRKNLNLHETYDDLSQRMLNAMEPGTYLRPHRHLVDAKPESFVGLIGKLALITFLDDGEIDKIYPYGPEEDILCIDLPPGVWHTVVCLESGSVLYETKPGPFVPLTAEDMAPWAPLPDTAEAVKYLDKLIEAVRTLI